LLRWFGPLFGGDESNETKDANGMYFRKKGSGEQLKWLRIVEPLTAKPLSIPACGLIAPCEVMCGAKGDAELGLLMKYRLAFTDRVVSCIAWLRQPLSRPARFGFPLLL